MRWLLRQTGSAPPTISRAGGFIRSRAGVRYPDIQYHFLPLAVTYDGSALGDASTASRPMSGRCARKSRG